MKINFKKLKKNLFPILLAIIIILGILARLPNFHLGPFDAHSERQLDTEAVAYFYAFKDHNFMFPESSLIRPAHNLSYMYFLEFPLYQYIIAIFYMMFGYHIEIARLINFALYIVSALSLYYIAKNIFNRKIALISTLFYSFTPGSIFFLGHAIHPDIFSTAALLVSLAAYIRWKDTKNIWYFVLCNLAMSISVAERPFIFIVAPALLLLLWRKKAKWWEYPILVIGSLAIEGLWHYWQGLHMDYIARFWDGWILQGQDQLLKKDVLIDHLILKNVVGEVMGRVISGLFLVGVIWLLIKRNWQTLFLFAWLAGVPAYWYIAPAGNITHQYYADVFILPVVITAALGTIYTFDLIRKKSFYFASALLLGVSLLVIYNGVHTSQYFYNDILPAQDFTIADHIKKIIPSNGRMIYLSYGNTAPFMIDHIQGWVLGVAPADVDNNAFYVFLQQKFGSQYLVYAKGERGLPDEEMNKVLDRVNKVYSDDVITVYTYKGITY